MPIYSTPLKMSLIVNITAKEQFEGPNEAFLKTILTKFKKSGESRWRRTDEIREVPSDTQLAGYVIHYYSKIIVD